MYLLAGMVAAATLSAQPANAGRLTTRFKRGKVRDTLKTFSARAEMVGNANLRRRLGDVFGHKYRTYSGARGSKANRYGLGQMLETYKGDPKRQSQIDDLFGAAFEPAASSMDRPTNTQLRKLNNLLVVAAETPKIYDALMSELSRPGRSVRFGTDRNRHGHGMSVLTVGGVTVRRNSATGKLKMFRAQDQVGRDLVLGNKVTVGEVSGGNVTINGGGQ
jgi:hypothetical protein